MSKESAPRSAKVDSGFEVRDVHVELSLTMDLIFSNRRHGGLLEYSIDYGRKCVEPGNLYHGHAAVDSEKLVQSDRLHFRR